MTPNQELFLTKLWVDEYMNDGVCALCGNTALVDTRETAVSPKGVKVGKLLYCICPNGRKFKAAREKEKKFEARAQRGL